MKNAIALLAILAPLGIGTGCNKDTPAATNKPASSAPAIAIIDFEKLYQQMGWEEQIKKDLAQGDAQLRQQFQPLALMIGDTFNQRKREVAREAHLSLQQTDAVLAAKDQAELEKLGLNRKQVDEIMQAYVAFQQRNANLNQSFGQVKNQYQQQVTTAYRLALEPVIRRIALANNRAVVLARGGQIAWYDPSTDLTDKMVDDLQKTPVAKPNVPEAPHVNWQMPINTPTSLPASQPSRK